MPQMWKDCPIYTHTGRKLTTILKVRNALMTLEGKEKVVLVLKYIGEDFCSQSVYQDQFDHLWKDVGSGDSEQPCLYSAINN